MQEGKTPLVTADLLADGKGNGLILGKLCPWAAKTQNWQTTVHQNLFLSLKGVATDVWEPPGQEGGCVTLLPPRSTLKPTNLQLQHFRNQGFLQLGCLVSDGTIGNEGTEKNIDIQVTFLADSLKTYISIYPA